MDLQVPIVRIPAIYRSIEHDRVRHQGRSAVCSRRGDEDPLAHLGSATSVRWQQVGREDRRYVRHSVTLGTKGLDDDIPFMLMAGSGKVPHILEQNEGGSPSLDDPQDVPVERSAGLIHPLLSAGLAEGLAREAGKENVVLRDIH